MWDRGECLATVSGLPYQRIEAGEEFSLFVLLDQRTGRPMDGMMPLWFANGAMVTHAIATPQPVEACDGNRPALASLAAGGTTSISVGAHFPTRRAPHHTSAAAELPIRGAISANAAKSVRQSTSTAFMMWPSGPSR